MGKFKLQVNSAKVSGSHSDFPAYVDLSEMPTAFWNEVKNGGGDIRCYSDEALTTQLPREVVSCDTATNTGELHVKTGMTTSTAIYITVDGTSTEPAASSTYGSQNVWNSNYKAVYHLKDANDSTSNANNGIVSGATSGATGRIGDGYDFDGTNDIITVPNDNSLKPTSAITVQAWVKKTGTQNNYGKLLWFGQNSSTPWGPYGFQFDSTATYFNFHIASNTTRYSPISSTDLSDNVWHKIEGVYNGSTVKLYENNSEAGSVNFSGSIGNYDTTNGLGIGDKYGTGQPFNGLIDEVRILDTALSSDWRTTEYNNQSDVSNFWTITDVTPTGTMIKRYNGSSWEEKPLKRYNGSEWEEVTIKRYNGSSWDEL